MLSIRQVFQASLASDFWSCNLKYLIQILTKLCLQRRKNHWNCRTRDENFIQLRYIFRYWPTKWYWQNKCSTSSEMQFLCNRPRRWSYFYLSCSSWADMGDPSWVALLAQDTPGRMLCLIFYLKVSHSIAHYFRSTSETFLPLKKWSSLLLPYTSHSFELVTEKPNNLLQTSDLGL